MVAANNWWTPSVGGSNEWFVRLGPDEWKPFTYERSEDDPLRLLGSVRRGARVGALAITSSGEYVQVNGDYVGTLSSSQVRKAIARAESAGSRPRPAARPPAAPVVVIKRRRRVQER